MAMGIRPIMRSSLSGHTTHVLILVLSYVVTLPVSIEDDGEPHMLNNNAHAARASLGARGRPWGNKKRMATGHHP